MADLHQHIYHLSKLIDKADAYLYRYIGPALGVLPGPLRDIEKQGNATYHLLLFWFNSQRRDTLPAQQLLGVLRTYKLEIQARFTEEHILPLTDAETVQPPQDNLPGADLSENRRRVTQTESEMGRQHADIGVGSTLSWSPENGGQQDSLPSRHSEESTSTLSTNDSDYYNESTQEANWRQGSDEASNITHWLINSSSIGYNMAAPSTISHHPAAMTDLPLVANSSTAASTSPFAILNPSLSVGSTPYPYLPAPATIQAVPIEKGDEASAIYPDDIRSSERTSYNIPSIPFDSDVPGPSGSKQPVNLAKSIENNLVIEGDKRKWYCKDCDKECTGEVPYQAHLESRGHKKKIDPAQVDQDKWHCKCCNIQCSGDIPFQQHLNSEAHKKKLEPSPEEFVCDKCSVKCSSRANLEDHLASENHKKQPHNEDLSCEYCSKTFNNKKSYEEHLKSERHQKKLRESEGQPVCRLCNIRCSDSQNLRVHLEGKSHSKKLKNLPLVKHVGHEMEESTSCSRDLEASDDESISCETTTSRDRQVYERASNAAGSAVIEPHGRGLAEGIEEEGSGEGENIQLESGEGGNIQLESGEGDNIHDRIA